MILTTISPGYVRLILRVYFIVVMAGIAWLAEKILQSRAKLQVIRTRSVPVHRVLGWMQGFDLIKAVWSLRQLPGGKIGYLAMVVIFALSKLTDLITTTLVQQVSVQSRCDFGKVSFLTRLDNLCLRIHQLMALRILWCTTRSI
jgi:hypothetical protein